MPTYRPPRRLSQNSRSNSAAAFFGVVGLPDPGHGPRQYDGGLRAFSTTFNRVAGDWLEARSPECRAFARAEHAARSPLHLRRCA